MTQVLQHLNEQRKSCSKLGPNDPIDNRRTIKLCITMKRSMHDKSVNVLLNDVSLNILLG